MPFFLALSLMACSQDLGEAAPKICTAGSMRDCVCTSTNSGQQTCDEDGTRYGICMCGGMADADAGDTNNDAGQVVLDANNMTPAIDGGRPPRTDGGNMMMRPDGGGPMMTGDGGRRMPPQEAYDACMGKMEGDECTWTHPRRGDIVGTCAYRRGETTLICRPMDGP